MPGLLYYFMTYSFDIDIATRFGVPEAIMIQNLAYWIRKNEANGKHQHEGRFWTYNSVAAFGELFPFWTRAQIRRVLESLQEKGVIIKGNFNEDAYKHTSWYAFADEYLQNQQIDLLKLANGNAENSKSNSDSIYNQDNIFANINPDNKEGGTAGETPAHPKPAKDKKQKGTAEPLCLFADSRYNKLEDFAAQFGPDYAGVDLAYYRDCVADWSAKKGKKMRDWIATARGFMRSDAREGKLQKVRQAGMSTAEIEYLQSMLPTDAELGL